MNTVSYCDHKIISHVTDPKVYDLEFSMTRAMIDADWISWATCI